MVENKIIQGIPLLDFGNKIVIQGVFLSDENGRDFVAMLPQRKLNGLDNVSLLHPDYDEWHKIFEQQDYNYVKGGLNGEHVLLRKSQRNVDGRISWAVWRRDDYKCRYCAIDHVPLTVDHIITWETGGATHPENLVSSCKKCNRIRGNTPYDEWLNSKYYLEKSKFLDEKTRQLNADIIQGLDKLPRVKIQRKR